VIYRKKLINQIQRSCLVSKNLTLSMREVLVSLEDFSPLVLKFGPSDREFRDNCEIR
jgi:hypothetical protein